MGNSKLSALLSLIGVILIWPYVLTKSVSPRAQTADSASLPAGQGEKRPHAVKRSTQNCDSSYDNYCLNDGQCMLLLDLNEHHCKCERGFIGPRCDTPELVFQPVGEGQIIVIVFCVSLLIIGLAGALYLCCKWASKESCIVIFRHYIPESGVGNLRACCQKRTYYKYKKNRFPRQPKLQGYTGVQTA